MDILKEQLADMKNVAELFKTYFDKLEYTKFSGSKPYETELILKHIKFVQNLNISIKDEIFMEASKADLPTVLALLDSIFKYYNTMKEGYLKLKEVYDIYANYDIEPYTTYSSSSFSSSAGSYISGLIEIYENLVNAWDAFSRRSESGIIEQMFIDKIMNVISGDMHKILIHIKSIYDKTKNRLTMIDLYGGILRKILDTAEPAVLHGGVQKYITNLIEELKDEILPTQTRETSNRKPTIQTLVQRYRLIPDGPSRTLDKLIQDLCNIKIDPKIDPLVNLEKVVKMISKKRKYGFIVFAKIIPQPIENNLWLLTDSMYLQKNKLMQPSTAGLNDVILRKSETIHKMDTDENSKHVLKDGIYYVPDVGKQPESFYYVLETLDGVTFRILYPWYISIFAKEKIYEIPGNMLPDFTDTKKSCPYSRIETYNQLLNNEILVHLQKPLIQTEMQSRLEKKQVDIKWDVIRRRIARNMMEDYRELFDATPVTKDNILGLILHPDIFSNALNYIIESSGIKTGANLEIYMSALGSLNAMRRNMKRDMEKIYKDTYQTKIMKLLESNGPKISTAIKIVDALEDVLMEMLENQISEKSNIFALIQQKALLLENIDAAAIAMAD